MQDDFFHTIRGIYWGKSISVFSITHCLLFQNAKGHNENCSLILNVPSLFFLLPKGVILLMEESAPSSAGPRSLTSQPERDGLRSPAPVWMRDHLSFHPHYVPVLYPSFLHSKRVTPRQWMWTPETGTKKGSSNGTPCCPLAIRQSVRLSGSCPVLYPTVLALPPTPPLQWG